MEKVVHSGKRKFTAMNRNEVGNLMSLGFNMLVGGEKSTAVGGTRTDAPGEIVMLPVEDILDDKTFQYRLTTTLGSLAEDMRVRGQTTPIFVRPLEGKYQLISGFRRLAAVRELGR